MCEHKILIPNPYFGIRSPAKGAGPYSNGFNVLRNTIHTRIAVPCGQCQQCTSMRQGWLVQRVQMESLRSHIFFFTLTYNDESLAYTYTGEYVVPYPEYSDIQNMFKRLRNAGYKFRTYVVSEYGSKRYRPHFHGFLAIDKSVDTRHHSVIEKEWYDRLRLEWRRNVGSRRKPIYKSNYTHIVRRKKRTYDFHYVQPIPGHDNDCSFYVGKYIMKHDKRTVKLLQKISLDPKLSDFEKHELRRFIKPRSVMSKDFGDKNLPAVKEYILSCVAKNDKDLTYYDLHTGQPNALSRYYRSIVPVEWFLNRFQKYSDYVDSFYVNDDSSILEYAIDYGRIDLNDENFEENCDIVQKKHIFDGD